MWGHCGAVWGPWPAPVCSQILFCSLLKINTLEQKRELLKMEFMGKTKVSAGRPVSTKLHFGFVSNRSIVDFPSPYPVFPWPFMSACADYFPWVCVHEMEEL